MKNLKARVEEIKAGIEIMELREKANIIKGKNYIIDNFDFMNENTENEYVVFTVLEDPKNFYFGGMVLTDLLKTLENDGFKKQIQKEGLPVQFQDKKGKSGRVYTDVITYPSSDSEVPF